jgi:hypothetical protein
MYLVCDDSATTNTVITPAGNPSSDGHTPLRLFAESSGAAGLIRKCDGQRPSVLTLLPGLFSEYSLHDKR